MDYDKDFSKMMLDTEYGRAAYFAHRAGPKSLMLVHGLAASSRSWHRLVSFLDPGLSIYMLDMLGHGDSDAPRINYTVDIQIKVLEMLAEKEKVSKPFLFGHSYGGWVCASYAVRGHPLSGLILEDSAGLENFFSETRGTKDREAYKADILSKAKLLTTHAYVIKSMLDDEFSEHQLSSDDLRKITAPTLIIWGAEDSIIKPKFADIFASHINGSRLRLIDGARHTPHFTSAREVSDMINEFIRTH